MWSQEEVEFSINDLALLNKALINKSTLRWVENFRMALFLKESLTNTLVNEDQGDLRVLCFFPVNLCNDLLQLLQLVMDNLLAHRVTDTVSVYKDMVWHVSVVELPVRLKSTVEVVE